MSTLTKLLAAAVSAVILTACTASGTTSGAGTVSGSGTVSENERRASGTDGTATGASSSATGSGAAGASSTTR